MHTAEGHGTLKSPQLSATSKAQQPVSDFQVSDPPLPSRGSLAVPFGRTTVDNSVGQDRNSIEMTAITALAHLPAAGASCAGRSGRGPLECLTWSLSVGGLAV